MLLAGFAILGTTILGDPGADEGGWSRSYSKLSLLTAPGSPRMGYNRKDFYRGSATGIPRKNVSNHETHFNKGVYILTTGMRWSGVHAKSHSWFFFPAGRLMSYFLHISCFREAKLL